MPMYNWSVDTKRLKKDKPAWEKWQLEQKINFGLRGSKISKALLIKYWDQLNLDSQKRKVLKLLLWGKK